MTSKAKTVEEYLASLPEERRIAIVAVRKVILANLPKGYEECMSYGRSVTSFRIAFTLLAIIVTQSCLYP